MRAVVAGIGLVAALVPEVALAVSFGDLGCAEQPGNVLRYTCTAETSSAQARIAFWQDGSPTVRTTAWSDPGRSHAFTLWGLKPATRYRYRVELLDGADVIPGPVERAFITDDLDGEFGIPFSGLQTRVSRRPAGPDPWTQYVLTNVSCGSDKQLLMIFDVDGDVVWYQAPGEVSQITALDVTPDNTILMIRNDKELIEYALDGTVVRSRVFDDAGSCTRGEGPCPHHDVARVGTDTWTLTGEVTEFPAVGLTGCEDKTGYVRDGFQRLDADLAQVDAFHLDTDLGYRPDVDMGPRFDVAEPVPRCSASTWSGTLAWRDPGTDTLVEPIDYTHVNAIAVDPAGDVLVSLYQYHQIVKFDPDTRTVLWRLHGNEAAYSDFATPLNVVPSIVEHDSDALYGVHHVSVLPDGRIQAYNNQAGVNFLKTRVVRLAIDEKAGTATVSEAFTVVDDDEGTYSSPTALTCDQVGSAYSLGDGSRVLANCGSAGAIMELDQPDGSDALGPVWFLQLSCGGSDVVAPSDYRAVPLDALE